MTSPLISMRQITKRFPGVIANNKIDLELHAGEIHALLGENGQRQKHADEHPDRFV